MDTVELAYDVYSDEDTRNDLCPIIFIHGFFWSKYMYRELSRKLCRATRRKVFCLDMRNHGNSPSTKDPTSLAMVDDIKRFMQDKNLERVSFVCHSFSNGMAYIIAIDMPDSVEKLLMLDNPPFNEFNEQFSRESVFPQLEIQNRMLGTLSPRMSLKEAREKFRRLASSTSGNKSQEAFYKKVAYDLTKENGKFKWRNDFDYLMECYKKGLFSPTPRGSSDKEILIIRCPNSGRVPDSKFEAVKRHNPNARLMEFEDTTHLLMFEEEDRFIRVAKEFFHSSQ